MIKSRHLFFTLTVITSGAVYGVTLCPTVELIDSGELAMAAKNLGIAHPTGYPLYSILGRIFSILPIHDLIFRLNFLSLLFMAFAGGFMYLLISEFIINDHRKAFHEAIASAAALFVCFSPVWWAQGTTNEVYSLNMLLISISIWCLARYINEGSVHQLILAAYMLGLSLTNHLSAVYFIPGFIYLIAITLRKIKISSVIWTALFLIFPGTLYAVLPIRAVFRPFLNWGSVSDPYFFYKHITGWQYQVWMFTKPFEIFNNFMAKLEPAAKLYLAQFGWIGIALILVGIIAASVGNRKLLIFAILTGLFNLIYALNYDISDIDTYYLPLFMLSAIFWASGALFIAEQILGRLGKSHILAWSLAGVTSILPAYNLISNYAELDRSGMTAAKQGIYYLADGMAPGGLALVENWDFYSPWLYFHFEENFRPDMVLLDKELMRRSWYIDFIKRYHSDLYNRSKAEIEEFLRQVKPFERGKPFSPETIDRAYYDMLHAIIAHESSARPVYTNIMDDNKLAEGFVPLPDGSLIRIAAAETFVEAPRARFDEDYWRAQSRYDPRRIGYLLSFFGKAFELRGRYCRYHQKPEEAAYYFDLSERVKKIALVKE